MFRSPRRADPSARTLLRDALPGWVFIFLSLFILTAEVQAIALADRVEASQNTIVRAAPAGTLIGTRAIGDAGTVIEGPVTATLPGGSPLVWWRVNWDTGVDGWSFENGLATIGGGNQEFVPGIDVSHWQGAINWIAVRSAGKEYAFCKATDGASGVDEYLSANANNGRSAGVLMGMYHFARPLSNPALDEARHFVKTIRPWLLQNNLRPVLDVESGDTLGKAALSAWVRTFCQEVERLTLLRPLIYMNRNYAANYMETDLNIYPLWIATPGFTAGSSVAGMGPWAAYAFQQYSWTGRVTGIGGGNVDVDLDAIRGTTAALAPYQIPLISQSVTAATVQTSPAIPGASLTLTLSTTATHTRPVLVGASFYPAGTATGRITDPAREAVLTLTAGNQSLNRSFVIPPATAPGNYDLWLTLHVDVNQDGKVDDGDTALSSTFKKLNALTVSAPPSYATWAASQTLSGQNAAAAADPDHDGADNLTEYAFATIPTSAASHPLTTLTPLPDGTLRFSFTRPLNRPDLTWSIQHSTNLTAWTTLATVTGDTPFTTPGITETGPTQGPREVHADFDRTASGPGYMRLKIQHP
ncbi:MAG: glycoside hydrolase family 25 [Verrucomicrobiales bacterium]|nr:glycoside hydrolase family 25 [Verrucomicrobiales bacterium]